MIFVALLHEEMLNKQGDKVTTSLTLLDVHDIARSCRTYGVRQFSIVHPATAMRAIAEKLCSHWESGFGSSYNPDRKEALSRLQITSSLDELVADIKKKTDQKPLLVGTSARHSENEISFDRGREIIARNEQPFLLLFGTGWGMHDDLLGKMELMLEPVQGTSDYNHLSVRSACAIILDRLLGQSR